MQRVNDEKAVINSGISWILRTLFRTGHSNIIYTYHNVYIIHSNTLCRGFGILPGWACLEDFGGSSLLQSRPRLP